MYTERSFTILSPDLTYIPLFLLFAGAVVPSSAAENLSTSSKVESAQTATLSGIVRYSKRVPRPNAFEVEPNEDEKPLVDPAARGLEFAYVYLEPVQAKQEVETESNADVSAPRKEWPEVIMDQVGFQFRPLVMVVQERQRVIFGNGDSQDHNVRAYSEVSRNTFNIITTNKRSYTKKFELQKPGSPIKLACDFHPSMRGWIYVVDHERHAVTSDDGIFEIGSIPPGTYRLNIIQPDIRVRSQAIIKLASGAKLYGDTTFALDHRYYRAEPKVWISETP